MLQADSLLPLSSSTQSHFHLQKGEEQSITDTWSPSLRPCPFALACREYADFRVSSDGEVQGVGLLIAQEPSSGRLVVLAPIRGGPADKAGVLPGDEVCCQCSELIICSAPAVHTLVSEQHPCRQRQCERGAQLAQQDAQWCRHCTAV